MADAASPVSDGLDVCEVHCRIFNGLYLDMPDSYFVKYVLGLQLIVCYQQFEFRWGTTYTYEARCDSLL